MHFDQTHHSVSLATVEIGTADAGSRLVDTEQVVFLDGTGGAEGTSARERGSGAQLDRLGRCLRTCS